MHAGAAEELSVRPATPDDAGALLAIDHATWGPTAGPSAEPNPGPFFNERTQPERVLVAERGGRVVGWTKMAHPTELAASDHVWHCNGLCVDPAAQRSGVGRALMEALIEEARRRGGRRLTLRVFAPNDGARRLYERLGFQTEGVLHGEFRLADGSYVDDVLMALDLTR